MELAEYMAMKKRMTEFNRVWGCLIDCRGCPLFFDNNGRKMDCRKFEVIYPEEAIAIVQKWADEHPPKTIMQDFFEKYPNAPKHDDGTPRLCAKYLGYESLNCALGDDECVKCWNQPMEEKP